MTGPTPDHQPDAGLPVVESIDALRARLDAARAHGAVIGFVPTMGFLHDGHASLIRAAAASCDEVVVSIFVNPLQFAPDEDLADYPRDLARDLALAVDAGATVVFHPSVDEMYPTPMRTAVTVAGASEDFEGASRPTHFTGVATVVTKLFGIVGACHAYFGEKDYQQLVIVRRLAADLSLPVQVVGCPVSREPDGVARSSRNVYLTPAERAAAPVLHRALVAGRDLVLAGERQPEAVERAMADVLAAEPLADPDYVALVDAFDVKRVRDVRGDLRLMVAARLGKPRLLDNLGVRAPDR